MLNGRATENAPVCLIRESYLICYTGELPNIIGPLSVTVPAAGSVFRNYSSSSLGFLRILLQVFSEGLLLGFLLGFQK